MTDNETLTKDGFVTGNWAVTSDGAVTDGGVSDRQQGCDW